MKTKYFVFLFLLLFAMIAAGPGCKNGCKSQEEPVRAENVPGLITNVQFYSIIADSSFGDVVDPNNPPPAPWRIRLKIARNGAKLDSLFGANQNIGYDGTLINFKGSDRDTAIAGFNFIELPEDTLQADFMIPGTILGWNVGQDVVSIVVKVTDLTAASLRNDKAGFSLLPLALSQATSVEDEEPIREVLYSDENGLTGEYDDGVTINGPTPGTKLGC